MRTDATDATATHPLDTDIGPHRSVVLEAAQTSGHPDRVTFAEDRLSPYEGVVPLFLWSRHMERVTTRTSGASMQSVVGQRFERWRDQPGLVLFAQAGVERTVRIANGTPVAIVA